MIVLPDIVGPTVTYLNTVDAVLAIFGHRIGLELPAEDDWPAVRIDPIGGIPFDEQRLDRPVLQIHAFAEELIDVVTGARTLAAAMVAMAGYREPGVLVVADVTTSSPQLLPDDSRTAPIAHATFSATVTVRPDP